MSRHASFKDIFDTLYAHYGPQHWWPAETPFEVMIGAVLVQNTAWHNASKAIDNLKNVGLMSAVAIRDTPGDRLAQLIISSGYFNIKARRLQALCVWLLEKGDIAALKDQSLNVLRKDLLTIHGIGNETADDILLYALEKPIFVIDAYTRRIFSRLGLVEHDASYKDLQNSFQQALDSDVNLFNEYHALIVTHGKHTCQKKPICMNCCLQQYCADARQA